ncbi:Isoflavone reductase, putative, expressed [Panicum miliaceum]|uniref:Isoflavone reductase, putative, expressed n=1 Tax=Panicum miliaceum TaxID=4540 RepID=A0A3L6R838_PANMI|nr:Isoflavone reductase, putative, expressed [Panicum miliaceum]
MAPYATTHPSASVRQRAALGVLQVRADRALDGCGSSMRWAPPEDGVATYSTPPLVLVVFLAFHGEEPGARRGRHGLHRPPIVRASLAQGYPTLVLMRPEIGLDIDKLQMLLSFKAQGARLVEASLDDQAGLVAAVAQADVVVSAMSGAHIRSHNLHLQHKLVETIKEAGNVKVKIRWVRIRAALCASRQRFRCNPMPNPSDVSNGYEKSISLPANPRNPLHESDMWDPII